ncbi:MAG: cysteine synthase A [Bacteroidaceae bacterium]
MIHENIIELIGRTPAVRLNRFAANRNLKADIVAKVEYFNPGGSVKDRLALAMIADAEQKGILKRGGTIIEPTSGNTGIGLSMVGAIKGYRVILTMPETMSIERRKMAAAYGAEIVLTSGPAGMAGAIAKAQELRDTIPGAVILQQFDNPSNIKIHALTTGKELVEDAKESGISIDAFVAGVGTGGTLSGSAKTIKAAFPKALIVAVEPATSAVLSGKSSGPHNIQGIGAGFEPVNFDRSIVDEIIPVSDEDAFATVRALTKEEGLLVGISGGAAAYAASIVASRPEFAGKHLFTLLPDTGERYLSTELFVLE